jgi:hypothetical protein
MRKITEVRERIETAFHAEDAEERRAAEECDLLHGSLSVRVLRVTLSSFRRRMPSR